MGFAVSPVGFLISPVKNLLLGLTSEKFWKFGIFPGESRSPCRGTETVCLNGFHVDILYVYIYYDKYYEEVSIKLLTKAHLKPS